MTTNTTTSELEPFLPGKAIPSKNKKQDRLSYPFIAGLVDGKGLIVASKSTGSYKLTARAEDHILFSQLQKQFGGVIRKSSESTISYSLNYQNSLNGRLTIRALTKGLNGFMRNTAKLDQFKELCTVFGLKYKKAGPVTKDNGYIAGLFASCGNVSISTTTTYLEASKSHSQKLLESTLTDKNHKQEYKKPRFELAESFKHWSKWSLSVVKSNSISQFITKIKSRPVDKSIEIKRQRFLSGGSYYPMVTIKSKSNPSIKEIHPFFLSNQSETIAKNHAQRASLAVNQPDRICFTLYKEVEILSFIAYINLYPNCSRNYKKLNLLLQFYDLKKKGAHLETGNTDLNSNDKSLANKWYFFISEWLRSSEVSNAADFYQ